MNQQAVYKVVLFGPESTGKTTLAEQLAAHYQTVWVPEFSRTYQQAKGAVCDLSDVIPIAEGQLRWEAEAQQKARDLLICDTDILETKVYSLLYNGTYPQWLLNKIEENLGDLYLLTAVDLPWIPDGVRDRPNHREEIYQLFKAELLQRELPFAEISGSYPERLQKAIDAIDLFRLRGPQAFFHS